MNFLNYSHIEILFFLKNYHVLKLELLHSKYLSAGKRFVFCTKVIYELIAFH